MPISDYFNIKKMIRDKRAYRQQMARVDAMPEAYSFVYKKIVENMWRYAAGSGYDMMEAQSDLLELFEQGAAQGKPVLDITGPDVAAFCDELLRNVQTYTGNWREQLNREVHKKMGGGGEGR